MVPPLWIPVGIFVEMDPFYFLLEELLPDPCYRPLYFILITPLVRLFLVFFCVMESSRFLVTAGIPALLVVLVVTTSARNMKLIYGEKCFSSYVQLRLLFSRLPWNRIGLILLLAEFGAVGIFLFAIKCKNFIPVLIEAFVVILGLYLVILAMMVLPAVAKIRTVTRELIRSKLNLHYVSSFRLRTNKVYYFLRWRSQKTLYIQCGDFFILQRGLTMNFLADVTIGLANAVILLQPNNLV